MKKLFIVTGELSGDVHAAAVVKQIKDINPDLEIEAIGGANLKEQGVKLFVDHSKMSAVGLNFKILFDHVMLGKRLCDYLTKEYKPDAVLLIDYGGFNLNFSKFLKQKSPQTKIFYYIPPQIWASRKWRIHTVKKYIDKVMTIFPFEKDMYDEYGIDAEFVGHPLVAQLPEAVDRGTFFEKYGLDTDKKLVAIFPGSRTFELHNLMSIFLEASELIKKEKKDVQFVISQAPNLKDETFKKYFKNADMKVIQNDNHALLSASDALILASGTVALEAGLYGTPMIISYRGPKFYYLVYRLVRCIKRACLPNIIMDKDIVPELLQNDAKSDLIAKNILKLLDDKEARTSMTEDLLKVKNILSSKESSKEVAKIIVSNL